MARTVVAVDTKRFGDQYPPSRPKPIMFLIAAIVVAAVVIIINWPTVATFVHFPGIKNALGL